MRRATLFNNGEVSNGEVLSLIAKSILNSLDMSDISSSNFRSPRNVMSVISLRTPERSIVIRIEIK